MFKVNLTVNYVSYSFGLFDNCTLFLEFIYGFLVDNHYYRNTALKTIPTIIYVWICFLNPSNLPIYIGTCIKDVQRQNDFFKINKHH